MHSVQIYEKKLQYFVHTHNTHKYKKENLKNHHKPRRRHNKSLSMTLTSKLTSKIHKNKRHKTKHRRTNPHNLYIPSNRSKSIDQTMTSSSPSHPSPPIKDEYEIFNDDDDNDNELIDSQNASSYLFNSSPPPIIKTKSHQIGYLPKPISPPRTPRRFVEHEKNTLILQMRDLQTSMAQLGDMLRNQDKDLVTEKEKNKKLTYVY